MRIRAGKRVVKDDSKPVRRSRAARFNDPESSFGKRSAVGREKKGLETPRHRDGNFTRPSIDYEKAEARKRAAESDRMEILRNPDKSKLSKSRLAYLAREAGTGGFRELESAPTPRSDPESDAFAVRKQRETERRPTPDRQSFRDDKFSQRRDEKPAWGRDEKPVWRKDEGEAPRSAEVKPKFASTMDKRIPLSIPYTTPASEFLYGASVIEAALSSRASPRRKLYKLYIYSGENRENEDRDKNFARLARRQGVPVEFKNAEWLRVMDKMSGGRPHNGYVLEASPLPRLPVVSLGELTMRDMRQGFEVVLDHQSREEAQVNGSSDFVPVPSMGKSGDGRKPFVLLLDSILDPGNLGGIIRTASFLGVTAIAISSRNSASFTPVVLKASAGASENVTLFTVNKPAGFIQDSKAAGWKVYAAVAPSTNRTSGMPIALTTDELFNPLDQAPSILMLGNEGEGLRWNLRSKADVDLSIDGSKDRGGVDSLNVSVAAGILCNAFLRKVDHVPGPRKSAKQEIEQEIEMKGDLF
jgi:21S rRNA (GM2251-2'-O)-methyltransferase